MNALRTILPALLAFLLVLGQACSGAGAFEIGTARMDVTPEAPIRLTGYGGRTNASTGVEQRLWAKALALGDRDGAALILTLDNCGIAEPTYLELARRLGKRGVKQERLVIACSHTHTGPCTTGWAPNIFSTDIPADEQTVIDQYTRGLIDKMEQVAVAALRAREPGHLAWLQGSVGFARNRRVIVGSTAQFGDNAAGPVDQALPILVARNNRGELRAVLANYACHCTTLGGEFNHICGDWAGYAQEAMERDQPGALAMISIGCGADANPSPRGGPDFGLAYAKRNGEELAAEVKRLLRRSAIPLTGRLATRFQHLELPFGPQYARAQWQERATKGGIVGYHARKWLARLDRGETPPEKLSYYVQTWSFGDELAMVFLSGEVVVDYALRLKREFDPTRLWVSGYANYVPCYIPSRRILAEGGYEAEDSLWYYDRPARLSTNIEEQIVRSVHEQLPKGFLFDGRKAEFPDPTPARQTLARFRTDADLTVELVAGEPLIESPVAIDWGADGRLWVCEMYDYPSGLDGNFKPGGRIKVLTSSRHDGHYDRATLFLDGLAFPTGVMPWGRGALICAAPDILYAEDTNGDGRADVVQTNFTGFATHNYQARVNGFTRGLDGWLHGSSGLFGGRIRSLRRGIEVDLSGRDFRIQPASGEIEPVAGISQMGRVRDEYGNWFGNDNSTLLWQYPMPDANARRTPHVVYPDPRVAVTVGEDPNRLYPASRTLERFNDPQMANRTTSACGPEIYRDELLGTGSRGQAFICEPVHNLVTRLVLEPGGVTLSGHRAVGEERAEFLASTDNWFRPVQARTGPDGALWIVDMYRFVIEHPRWIPPDRLRQLDPRAGAERGRIYRVYPRGTRLRPIRGLTRLDEAHLAQELANPNGPTRDLVQELLISRHPATSRPDRDMAKPAPEPRWVKILRLLAAENSRPEVRVQALATLGLSGRLALASPNLVAALQDPHPAVRREGLRQMEILLATNDTRQTAVPLELAARVSTLQLDPDPAVRFQVALSLGASREPALGAILGKLAVASVDDRWQRAAVLSSASVHGGEILRAIAAIPGRSVAHLELARQIIASGAEVGGPSSGAFEVLLRSTAGDSAQWKHGLLGAWLEARDRRGDTSLRAEDQEVLRTAAAQARKLGQAPRATAPELQAALQFLGRYPDSSPGDLEFFVSFLRADTAAPVRQAVMEVLQRRRGHEVAAALLQRWELRSPADRSLILHLLVSREEWAADLLGAMETGTVAGPELPLPDRQSLLKHRSAALRERAARVLGAPTSNRAEVLHRYEGVPGLTGAPERGGALFEKNCAQCHALRSRGQPVGPNLVEFAGKSVSDFLVAILDPSAAINPGYLAYTVELKDGRSLTGLIRGETAGGFTLVQGGGIQERILRADINEIRASTLSLMPEGLEQALTPQDLADLIAWVKKSAPARFGSASPERAARALRDFQQAGMNGAGKVLEAADRLPYPSWLGHWPLACCRQNGTILRWRTEPALRRGSEGSYRFRMPAAFGLLSQPKGNFTLKLNGVAMIEFDVALNDASWRSADGRVRMEYTVMENNSEDSNGELTLDVDEKLVPEGQPVELAVNGSPGSSQRWFGIYLVTPPAATATARP